MNKLRKLKDLKLLGNNPRTIKDKDFDRLCKSIKENAEYFNARPLILSDRTGELIVIAGNQRYRAAEKLGIKEVPTYLIKDLTEEKEREIIIRDNVSNGDWDFDILANEWDAPLLSEWGVNIPQNTPEIDYSLLEDESLDGKMDEMKSGVKKAIQIEFENEHYEKASELVKFWRERGAYVGQMLIEKLQQEKEKL